MVKSAKSLSDGDMMKILDYGVLLEDGTLVVADLHLGYEDYLSRRGVMIPRIQFPKTIERIREMTANSKTERIVFAGDVQHDFSRTSFQTGKEIDELIKKFSKYELVFLKGNHDTFLSGLISRHGYELGETRETSDFLITHGHKNVETKKRIIIGHEHPSIVLRDELGAVNKYKCVLVSDRIIVLPALSPLASGTVINQDEKPLSPLISDFNDFKPVIQGLEFPRIKKLEKIVK